MTAGRLLLGWQRQWPHASLSLPSTVTALASWGRVLRVACDDGSVWHVRMYWRLMVGVRQPAPDPGAVDLRKLDAC